MNPPKKAPLNGSPAMADPSSPPAVFTLELTGGDKEGYPILVRRHRDQKETRRHEHLYHEMVFVESGTAQHLCVDGSRRLVPGDLLVIRPHVWHAYTETKGFGIVNCLFDRRILVHQKVFLSLAGGAFDLFQKPVAQPAATPPVFLHANPLAHQRMVSLLDAMILERREKQIDWQGALLASLLQLIVAISRLHHGAQEPKEATSEATRDLANRVMIHLEEHFRSRIVLAELSRRFHVSPSYLSRVFAKRMGMGIVDYVHHLRVEAACGLLRRSDWPVSRIAGEVGYDEIPYFFRRFRRAIGMSPGEYRTAALR